MNREGNACVAAQVQEQEQARATGNYLVSMDSICLVDTATLAKLLSCCKNTAYKIGEEARARIKIGAAVRWKVSRINDYLESKCGGIDDE